MKKRNKEIKVEIRFDDSKPTFEESKKEILKFFEILIRMEQNQNFNTEAIIIKERVENELLIKKQQYKILKIIDENFEEIFPETKNFPKEKDQNNYPNNE